MCLYERKREIGSMWVRETKCMCEKDCVREKYLCVWERERGKEGERGAECVYSW